MERLNTFTLPRLTPSQRVNLGNTIAIICIIVVIAQAYFQDLPLYVYAIELAVPIFMIGYQLTKGYYFLIWRQQHKEIASVLSLKLDDLDFRSKAENLQLFSLTLPAVKGLVKKAERRKEITQIYINMAEQIDLSPEEETSFHSSIAVSDFKAAYRALSRIAKRNEEYQNAVAEIKEEAKQAKCFVVILDYFDDGGNNLEVARKLIKKSLILRRQAEILGIEKDINAELEAGHLEEAEEKVARIRDEKWIENRKKNSLSVLSQKIASIKDTTRKTKLEKKLARLEKLEYGTRVFKVGRNDLSENISREQTAQLPRVW